MIVMRENYKLIKNQFTKCKVGGFKGAAALNSINYGFMERLLIIKVSIADV